MADYGIQIGKLFFVGLLSVILMLDIVMGLEALYYWQRDRGETADDLNRVSPKLEKLLAAQQTRLSDYRMVDAKKKIVSITIGRAMELVVAELSRRGSAAAVPTGEPR